MWGYKKNGKDGNGWLVVEDNGDIFVKNVWRSDPLGNLAELIEKQIDGTRVSLRNRANDEVTLYLSKHDGQSFFRVLSVVPKGSSPSSDTLELLKKLVDLRDAGIFTEEEFLAKNADVLKRL